MSVENKKGKTQHKAECQSRDTLEESCKTLVRLISFSAGLPYITIARHINKQVDISVGMGGIQGLLAFWRHYIGSRLCNSQEFAPYLNT